MKIETITGKAPKPRNPVAKALAGPQFQPKVEDNPRKTYRRMAKHSIFDCFDE